MTRRVTIAGLTEQLGVVEQLRMESLSREKVAVDEARIMRDEVNELRDRLFEAEIRVSRLLGYSDGRRDSEPPRMVPEPRRRMIERGSDDGFDYSEICRPGRASYATPQRQWYHR